MTMVKHKERYRITVGDAGLEIRDSRGKGLRFTAAEALMLMDILKNEEEKLKQLADKASPLPARLRF
jgi:hypothetical protein